MLVAIAISVGPYRVAPADLVRFLIARASGHASPLPAAAETVILQIRLPRVLAATAVGAALAAAGAAYQSLFRNPLVSPDILGVSSGAALGAVLGIFLSLPVLAIEATSFAGGLAAVLIVYGIAAAIRGRDAVLVLVLAGVVIGALFGAGVGLLKYLADPYNQLPAITFWLLGSLAATNPADLFSLLPAVAIGLVPLALLRWRIDVMTLGEEEATRARRRHPGHAHRRDRGGDADDLGRGRGERHHRLGRARRAASGAAHGRAVVRAAAAGQRPVRRLLSACRRYAGAHLGPRGTAARHADRGPRHAGVPVAARLQPARGLVVSRRASPSRI